LTRQELISLLTSGTYEVTFTKVDGTERTMPCTLDPTILPTQNLTEEKKIPRKINIETLRVFVTDINEWRSFRIENVISAKLIEG
jgi:hypothetical protein